MDKSGKETACNTAIAVGTAIFVNEVVDAGRYIMCSDDEAAVTIRNYFKVNSEQLRTNFTK